MEGQWEIALPEKCYASMNQKVTEGKGKIHDFGNKLSKSSEFYYLELGLFPSITHIVGAMNTLIHLGHNHKKNCITPRTSRRTEKV